MEVTLEQVEKVRACTGASWEEAKAALEECRGSVLDAVVLLEQRGKRAVGAAENSAAGDYSTRETPPAEDTAGRERVWPRVRRVLKSLFSNCLTVTVDIWKEDRRTCQVPFLVALILIVARASLMGLLFLLGMCRGYRVHVSGRGTEEWGEGFNRGMDRAEETVYDAVSSIRKKKKTEKKG